MSGHSFYKPVIKVDRVPTPLPSDDTPTPSGGRFGNLRAIKKEPMIESPVATTSRFANIRSNPSGTSLDSPSGESRFANIRSNPSGTSLDSPSGESRFTNLRSRPSEGSFPIDIEGAEQSSNRFGSLKSTTVATVAMIEEILDGETSRFSGIVKTNGSAFDMRTDRKPFHSDQSKKLVVNESSNFILKRIADRQHDDEPSPIMKTKRNTLAEVVIFAQNTNNISVEKPKKQHAKKPKNKHNNTSLDDLDDRPITNISIIAEQYGQVEVSESDDDDNDENNLSNKDLKRLRRLELVEGRSGLAKSQFI